MLFSLHNFFLLAVGLLVTGLVNAQDITERVDPRYVDSDGVRIHYVVMGDGPLMVMVHGYPDYWYTWRHQMKSLAGDYTVVAMDTRGYNLSDQPTGVENYDLEILGNDVAAVIEAEGKDSAIIVGHDWGAGIAWYFAAHRPEMTNQLIILNLLDPRNVVRELARFEQQHEASAYARDYQQPNSETEWRGVEHYAARLVLDKLTFQGVYPLTFKEVQDAGEEEAYAHYFEAFSRSSVEAMMNYYRANWPRPPYDSGAFFKLPEVQAPVLQFHGLADDALLPEGLNNTWDHLTQDWTLVTMPGVSHWPHLDKPNFVSDMMKAWLSVYR
jgi:pimeloyl-ACP methyl ester carboxylesterase